MKKRVKKMKRKKNKIKKVIDSKTEAEKNKKEKEKDKNQTLYALKPMNCPGHCLLYRSRSRSYRELPLRMAEFGCCHRNELSGTLTGLTRVRRFTQDDAHIFCKPEDIGSELKSCLSLMEEVYGIFGLNFFLTLSTRPEKYIGSDELWENATNQDRKSVV